MKLQKEITLRNNDMQDMYIIEVYKSSFQVYNQHLNLTFGFDTLDKLAEILEVIKNEGYTEEDSDVTKSKFTRCLCRIKQVLNRR